MTTRRARLVVAYDGSRFRGVAEHDGVRTVVGELRAALDKIVRVPVEPVVAGRTDAGVHAWGQVISLDLPDSVDPANLAHRLNRMLGPEIAVRSASWAAPEFHARYDAVWRHYRYLLWNAPVAAPALAGQAWHVTQPLRLELMQLGCDPLIGEHDFSSFCRRPKVSEGQPAPSMVRRVVSCRWSVVATDLDSDGRLLRLDVRAIAFCQQMVRSITGLLVDVGAGKVHAGEVRTIMLAGDRARAGQVAPAHGLTLWEVGYPTVGEVGHPPASGSTVCQ